MSVQDDSREILLRELYGLRKLICEGRSGTDGVLELSAGVFVAFELKSATKKGVTTARDVGPAHLKKWRGKHWLVGFFDPAGEILQRCLYASPDQIEPWIKKTEEYIKSDLALIDSVRAMPRSHFEIVLIALLGDKEVYTLADVQKLLKRQYKVAEYRSFMDRELGFSRALMLELVVDRLVYLTRRGSTLNNPHIGPEYYNTFKEIPFDPIEKGREVLREVVETVLAAKEQDNGKVTDNRGNRIHRCVVDAPRDIATEVQHSSILPEDKRNEERAALAVIA